MENTHPTKWTHSEHLLKRIQDLDTASLTKAEFDKEMNDILKQIHVYFFNKLRCQYVRDNGSLYYSVGTRYSHDIWCCEHHAMIRDSSIS